MPVHDSVVLINLWIRARFCGAGTGLLGEVREDGPLIFGINIKIN